MQHVDLASAELTQRGVRHGAWPAGSPPGADAARTSPAWVHWLRSKLDWGGRGTHLSRGHEAGCSLRLAVAGARWRCSRPGAALRCRCRGSLLEAGCSSSSLSRGLLVAGEGGGWSQAGGRHGRCVGELASPEGGGGYGCMRQTMRGRGRE